MILKQFIAIEKLHRTAASLSGLMNWFTEIMRRGPMFLVEDTFNLQKRKESMKSVSSFVAALTFLFCLFSTNYSNPLLKEQGAIPVGFSFLVLFSFVAFVWAVSIMILVGAQFTRVQSTMLLVWAIIPHIKSASSITTLYIPILGTILVGWFARAKGTTNEGT